MFKTSALILASSTAAAKYTRGEPPITQDCNNYPIVALGTDFSSQSVPWGLVVDREFGGCACADSDEMEFRHNENDNEDEDFNPNLNRVDSTWACKCLNADLYRA